MTVDLIESLARDDKWYLGSGDGIIFAPPFPVWLDAPGFWDDGQVFQYAVGPLYTVTILDHDGRELPLRGAFTALDARGAHRGVRDARGTARDGDPHGAAGGRLRQ